MLYGSHCVLGDVRKASEVFEAMVEVVREAPKLVPSQATLSGGATEPQRCTIGTASQVKKRQPPVRSRFLACVSLSISCEN